VARLLDQAALFRGYLAAVRTDNGPEFNSRAFIAWAQGYGIRHILIEPGRPMQNGYIESFNERFLDECLNAEIKRRTNVVGNFPNDAAITRLVGAMLLEQSDEWSLNRRCIQLEGLQSLSDNVSTWVPAFQR
jgi:transposase InsO family protein